MDNAIVFSASPNADQSPCIIADTAEIIPCIKSIAVPMTNSIVLQVFLTRHSMVGYSIAHMPGIIGAQLLNNSTTSANAVATVNVIISNTFDTPVPIASKINAPSVSHHDFTSV